MATPRSDIAPGFPEPVRDAQRVFRTVLHAMAHPGRLMPVTTDLAPPAPLASAAAAVCLALVDYDTPVWLDDRAASSEALDFLAFHCGCPVADAPASAAFALVAGEVPSLSVFPVGDDEFPEASATVILQVDALRPDGPLLLSGPGIRDTATLGVDGLPTRFWPEWAANHALFPRGIDLVLVAGSTLCCLPRTVRVAAPAEGG